jgi:hypothetical protein
MRCSAAVQAARYRAARRAAMRSARCEIRPGKWHAVFRLAAVEALWGEIATVVRLIERESSGKAVLHLSSSGR